MNQLTALTQAMIKAFFKEDTPAIPDGKFPEGSEPFIVLKRLRELVAERKINTAENMLFDVFDQKKTYYVRIGLEFYNSLSCLSEDELKAADFSMEEVEEGLKDMLDFYKIKVNFRPAPMPAPGTPAPRQVPHPAPNVLADRKPDKK